MDVRLCSARVRAGESSLTDGEGVWSWSPDAGIKLAGDEPAGDGGYKARYTGESGGISRKPFCRECRNVRRALGFELVCLSLCTRGRGCDVHPAFPAPSVLGRHEVLAKLGQIMPGERKRSPQNPSLRGAKRRSNPHCRRGDILDCFASLAMTR